MYGLPQVGILANKLIKKKLKPHGYYEVDHTPGLYKHIWRPIAFTLVVDDFGVKYVGKEHAEHLFGVLKNEYTKIEVDWTGSLYCGITLKWNYAERYVDCKMPGYVKKRLVKFGHEPPQRPQHCPYTPNPIKYGRKSQETTPEDDSPILGKKEKKYIQEVIGSFLYYGRATDITILTALSAIAAEQEKPTEKTMH